MRICLLGGYSGDLDEGMRKVSFHLAKELTKRHKVLVLDSYLSEVLTKTFWREIKDFNPEIIHYIHGPSIKSFILLKVASLFCSDAKTIMSAMHPGFSLLSERFIPLFKSELVLVQSIETEEIFKKRGCKTEFLPCGIDVKKFRPATRGTKEVLRQKYGLDKRKFIILHIGSIKEGRNVRLLEKLQSEDNQVVIVGAVSTGIDQKVCEQLKRSGCLVWTRYFENIEEIYALADCYIFPVVPKKDIRGRAPDSIEMPLSVLEALSCNLPVISTKFGALPRVFEEGDGLFFVEEEKKIVNTLKEIKRGITVKTREKALPFSWGNIGKRLEKIYLELIEGENK